MSAARALALPTLVAALAVAVLAAFAVLDRRTPNDHDPYFSDRSIPYVQQYYAAPDATGRAAVLADHFMTGGPHPHLGNVALVSTLGTLGPTRQAYRLTAVPFLVMLVFGTWLLGREVGGGRVGVAAAVLAVSLPVMIVYSRKFAPPWFAAGMAPGIWACLLISLRMRGPPAWGLAVLAGIAQGLRCYVHPITYPDIALSSAGVALFGIVVWWRRRGPGDGVAVVRVALAGGLALAMAGHVLGFTAGWIEEPGYSLRNYLMAKGPNIGASSDPLVRAALPSVFGTAWTFVSEWWRMHAFPSGFVLLGAGWVWAAMRLRAREDGWTLVILLGTAVFAQAPLAFTAVRSGTFTSDWFVLIPPIAVVAAWGVFGSREAPTDARGRRWSGVLVAHWAFVALVPLALGMVGPDPSKDRSWYRTGLASWFTQTSSGTLWNTHHVPLRSGVAAEPLARLLRERGETEVRAVDLTATTWTEADACLADGEGGWVWGHPQGVQGNRSWIPWPYFFHGMLFGGADHSAGGPTEGASVTPGSPAADDLTHHSRAPIVARLWVDAASDCEAFAAREPLLRSAVDALDAALPQHEVVAVLGDVGGELIGMENEADRDPRYLSAAVVLMMQ